MSDRPSRLGRAVVPLVVACLLVATVASAAAAGGLVGHGVGTSVDSSAASQSSDRVGPGLRSANGTAEIVVRFEGDARLRASGAGDPGGISTADLKSNAESAQDDFERFAERKPGVTVERSFWLANAMLVTVDTESVAVERLLDVRGVDRVHGNFRMELDSAATAGDEAAVGGPGRVSGRGLGSAASSTSTNATYGVDMVRAPEVWETFGTRGEGATVAVLDTGIDPDHPDLNVSGWAEIDENGDVIRNDTGPYDLNGHGTHVAGTVAGGNASGRAIGVAPEATVHAVKVFPDDSRSTTFTRVIGGMEAALNESVVGERADVIQMSLGAEAYVAEIIGPVRNAEAAGAIVVASAGNGGESTSSSPGNVYDSLSVGAVNDSRVAADFSSGETVDTSSAWGTDAPDDWPAEYVVPDVSAPGVGINSSVPGGGYSDSYSGTSMAAPHVSGVAALMISATSRNVSEGELYDTLRDTANHPDNATEPDTRYGSGIVDGYEAVALVTENRSTLTVTGFDAPTEIAAGEALEATATVNNTGSDPGVGTLEYRFNGTTRDEANISLAPGESATVSVSYVVPSDTPTSVTYEHGAYTNDSRLTAGIDVLEPTSYAVSNLTTPEIVERGGPLNITANVTNVGDVAGDNRSVELRLTDPTNESSVRELTAADLSLGGGSTTMARLNGTVPSDFGTGETTAAVATPDETANATVRIADSVGTVSGTVTDAEMNATLPDIDVVVRNGTESVGEATTDANGTYDISVPATGLTLTASNATYAPASETVELNGSGDAATANLSLALRNGTLAGFVNATDDLGVPANATITITNEANATVAAVDAAENGSYAVGLRPDSYNATAAATDFYPDDRTGVVIRPNATEDPGFELAPKAATLSGTVTNESSGDPIADATVAAGSASTRTGTAGNYSFAVDRGDRTLRISAAGYTESSERLSLSANESREVSVSLSPTAVFEVTSVSGPDEIEQGSSGEFTVEVRNGGRAAENVTVNAAVSTSGTVDPASRSFSTVEVGGTRSSTFSVSIADGAPTGRHDFTASVGGNGADSQTLSFDVIESADVDTEDTPTGAGGAGGAAGSAMSDDEAATEPTDETGGSANQTETPTNETDGPTNETDGLMNETGDVLNQTEDPTNGTDGPTDEPTDDDEDGSDGRDDVTESDGDEGSESGDTAASNEDSSDDEAPGFGVTAVVAALLSAALVSRGRGKNG